MVDVVSERLAIAVDTVVTSAYVAFVVVVLTLIGQVNNAQINATAANAELQRYKQVASYMDQDISLEALSYVSCSDEYIVTITSTLTNYSFTSVKEFGKTNTVITSASPVKDMPSYEFIRELASKVPNGYKIHSTCTMNENSIFEIAVTISV